MRLISSNVFFLAIDKLLNGGAAFFSLYLLANNLPLNDYGMYQYSLSFASILAVVTNLIDEKVVKRGFSSTCPRILLRFIAEIKLLLIVALFLALNLWSYFFSFEYQIYCLISFFLVGHSIAALASIFHIYFDYAHRSDIRLKASLCGQVTNLGVLGLFISMSVPLIYLALSTVAAAAISFLVYLKFTGLLPKAEGSSLLQKFNKKSLLLEGIPFGLAAVVHILYYRLDVIMVGWFLDYAEVAIYSVGSQLISLSVLLVYPVQTAFFKNFSEKYRYNKQQFYSYYVSITRIMTCVGLVVTLGMLVSFDLFRSIFLPEEFQSVDEFLWILLIGTLVQYNACMRSSYLVLANKGLIMLYLQMASLALNIVLNWLLIPAFGLKGAGIATALSLTFNLLVANLLHPSTRHLFRIHTLREVFNG